MHLNSHGRVVDEPEIRAGFIGCGSHAFRNVYPTFQFAPVRLQATCDLDGARASAFAGKFGAEASYTDHREMLCREKLDAVFIVTGYNDQGRPLYPELAIDCLNAGCHTWIEKPPAATCADIERMQAAAQRADKQVMVGLKKMFFPANEKAIELMHRAEFGAPSLALLQYPEFIPPADDLRTYLRERKPLRNVIGFLDHLCHPTSLLIALFGMPSTLFYQRSASGAGMATFSYPSGCVASLALTGGQAQNGGMERTTIIGEGGHHIVVDNNVRVTYHRNPERPAGQGYGNTPSFFTGDPDSANAVWEPEFSLGQLYNKGLFLLGYYGEINEFAHAVLEKQSPCKGTLEQAWQATRIFEAFAEGPGRVIDL